jgi:putative addiction module killer protein
VLEILKSATFTKWFTGFVIGRPGHGSMRASRGSGSKHGDAKPLKGTGGVYELHIDYGPGYRVYYTQRGAVVVVLLCGGDKRSQDAVRPRHTPKTQTGPGCLKHSMSLLMRPPSGGPDSSHV